MRVSANTRQVLLAKDELNKLKTFDSSYVIGKSHFEEDGTQNYLVFQPINKYFKVITNTDYVSSWKSKGLSAETINPPATSDNILTPRLNYYGNKVRVEFTGSCLKQSTISYTHGKVVNIYIVYELGTSSSHNNDPTLKNCLFGVVTLTKNADTDKYGYSGYEIGFDRILSFSFPVSADLTYYQRNQDVILIRAKDYYENDKKRLREEARDKYKTLSEEEKNKKREYGKN